MITSLDPDDHLQRARFMIELQAMLAWPKSPDLRGQFLCSVTAAMADAETALLAGQQGDDHSEARLDMLEAVHEQHGGRSGLNNAHRQADLVEWFGHRMRAAFLAGRMLTDVIQMHHASPRPAKGASLRKARERLLKVDAKTAKALGLPRQHKSLEDAWKSHRCVAHIAAGVLVVCPSVFRSTVEGARNGTVSMYVAISREGLKDLVRTAATAERMGGEIVPHSKDQPVLPASDIYKLFPSIPPYEPGEIGIAPLELQDGAVA
jgi:hypothetical protein